MLNLEQGENISKSYFIREGAGVKSFQTQSRLTNPPQSL